jgi:hypothetical protein
LVAWVGGPHFGVGISVGGGFAAGVNVGWFPLGPREVYVPSYPVSRAYITNVNVSSTTVNTTVINNYYNTTVVNRNTTVVNNVISLATVPWIMANGAAAYAALGLGRSRGTLTVQLAGNVRRGGLIELPFGVTLRALVEDWGGGTASGRTLAGCDRPHRRRPTLELCPTMG